MRFSILLLVSACAVETSESVGTEWARGTLDSGVLPLDSTSDQCPNDPNKTEPGLCGCDWIDLDVDATPGPDACQHSTASVSASAVVSPGVQIGEFATVGDATLGFNAVLGARASIEDGSELGDDSVLGRRSELGTNTTIGPESQIGRSVVIGNDVDASSGGLVVGFGSAIGDGSETLGAPVTLGALVTVGTDAVLGTGTVLARGVTLGDDVSTGTGTILGPNTSTGDNVVLGDRARVRKDTTIGSDSTIGQNARIGRNGTLLDNTTVGEDANLGANVTVLTNASVGTNERIPRNTVVEAVGNCGEQSITDPAWVGLVSNNWDDPNNWSPVGVPDASDDVYICDASGSAPRLSNNVTVRSLTMGNGTSLDTWVRSVTVLGDVEATDIFGSGTVFMNATGTVVGSIRTLEINANVQTAGDLIVSNRLRINGGGTLTVGNHLVDAQGLFEQTLNAPNQGLVFDSPGSQLHVGQTSRWQGIATMSDSNLNQGTLRFRGSLIAEDSPAGLLRVGGALAVFDGGVGQAINIPGSSATTSFFTNVLVTAAEDPDPNDGTPGDTTFAQTQSSYPLYIKGDLTLESGGRLDVGLSTLTVLGDIDVQDGGGIRDQLGTTRLHGQLTVADTAQMDMYRLIALNHLPRPAGSWTVSILQIEGDIVLSDTWAYRQSQFRIEPTGSLTLNGHPFVLNGTYLQDIGTNPTAGMRMTTGDRAVFLQGSNFHADVDMAGTNFTGGTVEARWHVSTEAVDYRTVYMPGTQFVLDSEISEADLATFLTPEQIVDLDLNLLDVPSLIVYTGNGLARFGTLRVAPGTSTATNSVNGAGNVVDNLIMESERTQPGNVLVGCNITPNKDITITNTLTVQEGSSVGSTGGSITLVQGSCNIEPGGTIHPNVSCP